MKNLKFILITILNIVIIVNTQQILPPVPCPNLFQYKWDATNNKYYGLVEILVPNTKQINLIVHLSIAGSVPSYGDIQLLYNNEKQAAQDIIQNKPILYKINFPPSQNIPKLTLINVNNITLCTGPPEIVFNTMLMLDYNLNIYGYLSAGNGPQFSSIPPNQFINAPSRNEDIYTPAPNIPPPPQSGPSASAGEICGTTVAQSNSLAIGGEAIARGTWPWLAAIFDLSGVKAQFTCGGTLVTSRIVLSAAHCFKKYKVTTTAENTLVVLGRYNIHDWTETSSVNRKVKEIRVHEEYRSDLPSFDADIAIVILLDSVTFTNVIRPACMLPSDSPIDGYNNGIVVGWGYDQTGQITSTPMKVPAPIVDQLKCVRSNAAFINITSNRTFCAGNRKGVGPCSGDSGSGLLVQIGIRWYLRGSVGGSLQDIQTNCNLKEYIVYADVTKFRSWVYTYLQNYR